MRLERVHHQVDQLLCDCQPFLQNGDRNILRRLDGQVTPTEEVSTRLSSYQKSKKQITIVPFIIKHNDLSIFYSFIVIT